MLAIFLFLNFQASAIITKLLLLMYGNHKQASAHEKKIAVVKINLFNSVANFGLIKWLQCGLI